ncbi:uncharacterized protein J7T54_006334 [Emericellopsis cladophorae]|uniref:Uncharacterized protein n=1 Tax=Emericellopsis cladophorae TaxID=2686198 RepID=A0A9P9Y9S3_9HYPO|nr:uncharacterized protein J7T54_006334 [Emericellopsis cladophorae]KAI6785995.1 hypothetical protein J7T54_006334 [Emericellopsis cladophorae]
MPSRFSAAFRRKSATNSEDLQLHSSTAEPSFRVLERGQPQEGRTFDGGVRMARASAHMAHKVTNSESEVEDNMFAGLNAYSGGSNTTKATSTDTSSRHSNASTAPSSADVAHPNDDPRPAKRAITSYEPTPPSRSSQKTASSFLDRAGRTFSFGMQKKSQAPPVKDDVPDVPPLPTLQREDEYGRTRAMTASTTSTATTATPPRLDGSSGLDMGGDFGSMFSTFDKRASQATLRNDLQRQAQPAPLKLDKTNPIDIDPAPRSWNSNKSSDELMNSPKLSPPLVPRHQPSFEYRTSTSPTGVVDDEDARLLADSVAATKFLTQPTAQGRGGRRAEVDDRVAINLREPATADEGEDNLFAGTTTRFSKPAQRPTRPASPPRGSKVMTAAEFERYEKEKNRQHMERSVYGRSAEDEDDEDDINYDDEEDAEEKAKEAAKRSRNKQAQMQAYRQKNLKTTGGGTGSISPLSSSRPTFAASLSTPHLGVAKTPSPELARPAEDDEDDEVPLAILQAHGFPHKNLSASRLSTAGSNPNLRVTSQAHDSRPQSMAGETSAFNAKRSSTLPAFARGLPQDPFAGPGAARPAVRESLSFGGGSPNLDRLTPQVPQHQSGHPGGLVGVIASEERARAMRRGSPNVESQRLGGGGAGGQNLDPMAGIPSHMMYGAGQQNVAQNRLSQQPLTAADQAQVHMSQQMSQFMQMQMQFMQMMANNQPGGQMPQMPMPYGMPHIPQMQQHQQPPYGMHAATQSVADFPSGQSTYGQQPMPRRRDAGSRTMSMVQPNTGPQTLHGGMGSPAFGYTPSIAPSERSNVGLPGRYRPVSQVPQLDVPIHHRASSISGALSMTPTEDSKSRSTSTIKLISKTKNNAGSDDDDEEGWESMRAKRDQKKSRWRLRKGNDH